MLSEWMIWTWSKLLFTKQTQEQFCHKITGTEPSGACLLPERWRCPCVPQHSASRVHSTSRSLPCELAAPSTDLHSVPRAGCPLMLPLADPSGSPDGGYYKLSFSPTIVHISLITAVFGSQVCSYPMVRRWQVLAGFHRGFSTLFVSGSIMPMHIIEDSKICSFRWYPSIYTTFKP